MLALLLAAAASTLSPGGRGQGEGAFPNIAQAEREIRSRRAAFNRALAAGNVRDIAPILADDAQMVTGADSMIVAGKAAQLALWTEDLSGPKRRFYVRTPTRIRVSPVGPMALETGQWRGYQLSARRNWASGDYVAKWRRIGGKWLIESETYMATACGGSFCPRKRWGAK